MMEQIVREALAVSNPDLRIHTLREELQYLILRLLAQAGTFEHYAFVGGTALRIIHGLKRFSEDLDFSSVEPGLKSPPFLRYTALVVQGLESMGFKVSHKDSSVITVQSSFIRFEDMLWRVKPSLPKNQKLAIKVEADCNPPDGAVMAVSPVHRTFLFNVRHYDPPSLFAGKLNAILCRSYTKGRDWYDFLWYRARKTPVNGKLLQAGYHQREQKTIEISSASLRGLLRSRIEKLDLEIVRRDVLPFLENKDELAVISREVLESSSEEIEVI